MDATMATLLLHESIHQFPRYQPTHADHYTIEGQQASRSPSPPPTIIIIFLVSAVLEPLRRTGEEVWKSTMGLDLLVERAGIT